MPCLPQVDPVSDEVVQVAPNAGASSGVILEIREVSEAGISSWSMLDRIREMREEIKIPPDVLKDIQHRRMSVYRKKKTSYQKKDAFDFNANVELDDDDGSLQLLRHTLRFVLTDGFTNVVAIELQRIQSLSIFTSIGCKIRVRNAVIRRGVLMLSPNIVSILGGLTLQETAKERLDRLEKMFQDILKLRSEADLTELNIQHPQRHNTVVHQVDDRENGRGRGGQAHRGRGVPVAAVTAGRGSARENLAVVAPERNDQSRQRHGEGWAEEEDDEIPIPNIRDLVQNNQAQDLTARASKKPLGFCNASGGFSGVLQTEIMSYR
ncbi:hypothetical protein HDU67_007399 [Dinochytrium kinnereticum]|nr:hypothetical protein HDU67_007399 [Dinochytrium kinnereticum]